ncbi:MAG: adenosylcobinamide-phosphate synthase CbiB [Oscillospiraceae bacterium]|jgi:adenosylcobinamide-phosphate synthase|nr:adenosylcobinamide-phosphate synthase CbiB [Oscillospiraceae bacterium]
MSDFLLSSSIALVIGFVLDLIIGDPQGWFHIIRAVGALISALERVFYTLKNKRLGGILTVISVLAISVTIPGAILILAWKVSPWLKLALESLLCWQLIAVKCLKVESMTVYDALKSGDIEKARFAVSMIVGRDTAQLDESEISRAAVETIAENTADGIASPLLYMAIGGALLGCFFKAASTMDSILGYKNERYLDFGRCAAKLDDALNYIPARVCARVMIFAARFAGLDHKNAKKIYPRDRRNHASPNSAHTEAATAGALNVRLAGGAYYFGEFVEKPYIGDDNRPIERDDILRTHKLLYATAFILFAIALIIRAAILLTYALLV